MKTTLIVLILCLAINLPPKVSSICFDVKWKKFIALGDSNTQMGFSQSHWLSRIGNMFERKLDVINRGFSGYNSEHIRYFMNEIFSEFDPKSIGGITILLGTNDSADKTNTLQHVPLERYIENMIWIVEYLVKWGVSRKKIILISPARMDDQKIQQLFGEGSTVSDAQVREYANACVEIAYKTGVLFANVYKAMLDEGDDGHKKYLSDGIHFNSEGGTFLFEQLRPFLDKNIDF